MKLSNLKILRKEACKSQMNMALDLGMPQATYQQYERGTREASYDVLILFADHFQVSIDFILGRTNIRGRAEDEDTGLLLRLKGLKSLHVMNLVSQILDEIEGIGRK